MPFIVVRMLIFIIFIIIFLDAYFTIKNKNKRSFSLEEPFMVVLTDDILYIDLFFIIYKKLKFNLMKSKLESNSFFTIKVDKRMLLINLLCILIFGLSLKTIKLIVLTIYLIYRKKSFKSIIFNYLSGCAVPLHIYYFNNKWHLNG